MRGEWSKFAIGRLCTAYSANGRFSQLAVESLFEIRHCDWTLAIFVWLGDSRRMFKVLASIVECC